MSLWLNYSPLWLLRAGMSAGVNYKMVPKGVDVKLENLSGIPVEWIRPAHASKKHVLVYIHGGGWALPWTGGHRFMLAQICAASGITGLAVKYRLAPEHPFPAGLDDVLKIYKYLLDSGYLPKNIMLGGDSAGGNLTISAMLKLLDQGNPLPAAGILISAMTDLTDESPVQTHEPGAMVPPQFLLKMVRHYYAEEDPRNPLVSPVFADLAGLAPLLVQAGGKETLFPDITQFVEKAKAAGVDVELQVWPEMWHVHQIFAPLLPEGTEAIGRIAAFIKTRFEI